MTDNTFHCEFTLTTFALNHLTNVTENFTFGLLVVSSKNSRTNQLPRESGVHARCYLALYIIKILTCANYPHLSSPAANVACHHQHPRPHKADTEQQKTEDSGQTNWEAE